VAVALVTMSISAGCASQPDESLEPAPTSWWGAPTATPTPSASPSASPEPGDASPSVAPGERHEEGAPPAPSASPLSSATPGTPTAPATPSPGPSPTETADPGLPDVTAVAREAIRSRALSRDGLISELEFRGYTSEQAETAADAIGADWNAEATEAAQGYVDSTAFSEQLLITQVTYDGFTPDEARYGVAHVEADWNAEAVEAAQQFAGGTPVPRADVVLYLREQQFTEAQVEHGADSLDYSEVEKIEPDASDAPEPKRFQGLLRGQRVRDGRGAGGNRTRVQHRFTKVSPGAVCGGVLLGLDL